MAKQDRNTKESTEKAQQRDDEGRFPSYAEIEIEKMSKQNKKY